MARARELSERLARAALQRALELPIRLLYDRSIHERALDVAQRRNLPATYDAHYLELAQRLSIEFWTADRRLWNSVHHELSWVKLAASDG
jgi:predicted nucleic acid-binding protein